MPCCDQSEQPMIRPRVPSGKGPDIPVEAEYIQSCSLRINSEVEHKSTADALLKGSPQDWAKEAGSERPVFELAGWDCSTWGLGHGSWRPISRFPKSDCHPHQI